MKFNSPSDSTLMQIESILINSQLSTLHLVLGLITQADESTLSVDKESFRQNVVGLILGAGEQLQLDKEKLQK